ncbi:hypothetical protein T4E_9583 [Trichinella pseudospiralis]|uniref:Uncharacterized protein n=1 Tax=Trichinella pseudospiralis TaxID=6337 RepID=A0A0V0Y9F9_TRIPS|nr:hypothetical protein T4E_9583 [Trichinella pseudospiralis]
METLLVKRAGGRETQTFEEEHEKETNREKWKKELVTWPGVSTDQLTKPSGRETALKAKQQAGQDI